MTRCQFWHRGLSDVYLVETERHPYILRVSHHHWRSKSQINFELELLDFLHQRQLSVAYPLRTNEGLLSVDIPAPEGWRYAALFPYAPGTVAVGDLNVTQSHLLGTTVAQIHQAAQAFRCESHRPPLTLEYLLDDSFAAIAPFLTHRPPDLKFLHEAIGQIKSQLYDFPTEPPYWGICWGDPHSGNAHFTHTGELTLFDFDQCGYGWRIFDIAKFWQVSLATGLSRKVREAFLNGYQTLAPLTDTELAALQPLTQTAHIWHWAINLHHARVYDYSRLDDSYFNYRLQQLKRLKSYDWQLF
ncbi:phosphotransferase [Phormidium sp. CCY1219]|uniref:phosphotransferase n=1 Tax=Phormidium sp. CCY1219 TaxID=2886104 RepID=UPI002D1E8A6E|nr:phosphotransferase [Phormidium sp. CCY1219]MEB3830022.1 phosphotransferase [Phormidium sp. CCY1219]